MSKATSGRKPLQANAHKYSRGVVAVAAGSKAYPGAAVLTVGGARRGGAGYVKYLSKFDQCTQLVLSKFPDVVPISDLKNQKIDALVVGPGAITLKKLPQQIPVVLDGAAMSLAINSARLSLVSSKRSFPSAEKSSSNLNQLLVLTPHEGELEIIGYRNPSKQTKQSKLSGLDSDRKLLAQKIADELSVVLVLKGNKTIIAAPGLKPIIDLAGGPELATAGSGDVLAGLIGAFLASWKPRNFKEAQKVVGSAVSLHSHAGKYASKKYSNVVATDLLESLALC